jgi:hypothetical protein
MSQILSPAGLLLAATLCYAVLLALLVARRIVLSAWRRHRTSQHALGVARAGTPLLNEPAHSPAAFTPSTPAVNAPVTAPPNVGLPGVTPLPAPIERLPPRPPAPRAPGGVHRDNVIAFTALSYTATAQAPTSAGEAALLLDQAQAELATGAVDAAARLLRACVVAAAKQKQRAIEARARLELGDIAQTTGDMTTACEHWQMARQLYGELALKSELAGAETRMLRARCPTDWVLTQF